MKKSVLNTDNFLSLSYLPADKAKNLIGIGIRGVWGHELRWVYGFWGINFE